MAAWQQSQMSNSLCRVLPLYLSPSPFSTCKSQLRIVAAIDNSPPQYVSRMCYFAASLQSAYFVGIVEAAAETSNYKNVQMGQVDRKNNQQQWHFVFANRTQSINDFFQMDGMERFCFS